MTLATLPFDAAEFLDTPEAVAAFLEDSFSAGDPSEIVEALGIVARAQGMTALASRADLNRQALYKSLAPDSRAEFGTILKVLVALGLRVSVHPKAQSGSAKSVIKSRVRRSKRPSLGVGALKVASK
jgi:probable addiction module antidote protein